MTRIPIIILAASGLVCAQDQPPGGWRRADAPPPSAPSASAPAQTQGQDPEPVDRSDGNGQPAPNGQEAPYGQPAPYPANPGAMPPQTPPQAATTPQTTTSQSSRPAYGLPAEVTLKPCTFVTVRLGQALSTDHNQLGDTFVAHLTQPLVADGVVVAQRGQTAYGRVVEVQKQKADRPSRLGLELTSVTLADGTQVPVSSQLVMRTGGTTPAGVQAGTVAGTTGVGAIVGGAVGWGTGAAIGAGVGAVAGLAAVLLTRHHPTVLYPETALTFDVESPVTISTLRAPGAFRFMGPEDFTQPYNAGLQRRPVSAPGGYYSPYARPYGPYAYPYGSPYPYGYAPYPYYGWGPGFGVVIGGPGWYGRRW
jgi:hypothetical protein